MFGVLSIIQRAYVRRAESKAYEQRCSRERFERLPSGPVDIFNTIKSFDITLERHTNIWNDLVEDDMLVGIVDQAASSGKVFFVPNVQVAPTPFERQSSFESNSTTTSTSADSRRCSVDSTFSTASASTTATSIHDTAGKSTSELPIFARFARALSASEAEVHLTIIPSIPPSRRNAIVKRHQGKKLASGRFKQCKVAEVPSNRRPIRRNALRGLACKTKAKVARRGAVLDRGAKAAHLATKAKLVRRGAVLDKARKAKHVVMQKNLLPVYPTQLSQHWCMAETSQKQRHVHIVGWDKDPDHGLARAEDYAAGLVEQDGLKGKGRYSEIPLEFREKYMSSPPPPVAAKTEHAKANQPEVLPSQHWCLSETSQKSRRVHIIGWDKDPDHGLARAEDYAAGLVEQDGLKGKGRYSEIPFEFREKYMSSPSPAPRKTVIQKVLSPEDQKRYSPMNHLGWEEYDRLRFKDWERRHQNVAFGMKRVKPFKCAERVKEYVDMNGRVIKATTRTYIF